MKNILITGGTGFIGGHLVRFLEPRGYRITILSRDPQPPPVNPDTQERRYVSALDQLDDDTRWFGVINLAGEPLNAGRWNPQRKAHYRDSRIGLTSDLNAWMRSLPHAPEVYLSGSAVGWYGHWDDESLDERSQPNGGYAHELCRDWEAAASHELPGATRLCIVRIGIVLGANGGPLPEMMFPARLGLGGPMGSGLQWWSWIHIHDLVRLFLFLLESDQASGPFNGTAPHPVRQREFSRSLGKALNRPAFLPLPAFLASLVLGEFANELLLKGQKVLPRAAEAGGFEFQYPLLDMALRDIIGYR